MTPTVVDFADEPRKSRVDNKRGLGNLKVGTYMSSFHSVPKLPVNICLNPETVGVEGGKILKEGRN